MAGLQPLTIEAGMIQLIGDRRTELRRINLGPISPIVVTSDTIVVQFSSHFLDGNGGGTKNVDFILGGVEGDLLVLFGDNVRVRNNGNVDFGPNMLFNNPRKSLTLLFRNNFWYELSRT